MSKIDNQQKIITLGPKFSYSYNLSAKYFSDKNIITANTISEIFQKTSGRVHGIVPIENMLNGSIRETFLNLKNTNIKIFRAFDFKIEHILAGQNKNFTTVASHAQPLIQCGKFVDTLRKKGVEIMEVSSSSKAMQMSQKDRQIAAIGSVSAAEYYTVPIIKKNISNQDGNYTRFIEIGKGKINKKGSKTSLIISPNVDRSGLLFEILAVFKIKELNLTKIESISTGKGINNYMFYIDIDSSLESSRMQEAIQFLQTFVEINILGSYDILSD
jgi:prephenate dehydratase